MANRYTLTNEQRQQQVQDLTQQLEEGVKSVFESEKYAQYLKVMSHFTHYSVNNTILIAMQTGGQASMVPVIPPGKRTLAVRSTVVKRQSRYLHR